MPRATRAAAVAALLLIALPAAADDAQPLGEPITSPAEITSRMAGNTLSGVLKETGESWAEFYCDTGRSLYEFGGINLGKWWTQGGKVCFAYEYNDYQLPRCFDMFGRSDGALAFSGTDDAGRPLTFLSGPPEPGDPHHLEERALHGCALEPSV
ncbi:hypothetical protein [Dongia sp. agr-C8]